MMEPIRIYYKACPDIDFKKFVEEGGIVLDVRGAEEFYAGHIEGALNIPLDSLGDDAHRRIPNKHQPIVACCSTGMKSASAKVILESLGYMRVCNGGSYTNLNEKLFNGTTSI